MTPYYTHSRNDISIKRKKLTTQSISFSNVNKCVFSLQIDLESYDF